MNLRSLLAVAACVMGGLAHAASATHFGTIGLDLGATPGDVAALLARDYADCTPSRSIYHAVANETTQRTASLAINPGLTFNDIGAADICSFSPLGEGVTDGIDARFVHPDVDPRQPMYSLEVEHLYPDVVYGQPPQLRNSFAKLRADLIRSYGRPIDERREKIVSSAANLAASLGIGARVKREDYLVRYLWAARGRLVDDETEDSTCRCQGRYVKALIEISRSPTTIPGNTFYVLSIRLSIADTELAARQDAWNAQWQRVTNRQATDDAVTTATQLR